jgi:hypothetical protein
MSLFTVLVAAGVVAEVWLVALVAIRGRRPWLQATFAAFGLTLIVNGTAYVGTTEGYLPAVWSATVLWTFVLSHALLAIVTLSLIHGETVPRRRPWVLLLILAVPALVLYSPDTLSALQNLYAPNTVLSAFLLVCLGIALAEPIYVRATSALFAADSFWLSVAVVSFILGGPIYGYELQAFGLSFPPGTDVFSAISLGVFALVLFHEDPFARSRSRPRGRWEGAGIQGGEALVLEEPRPRYLVTSAMKEIEAGRPALILSRATEVPVEGAPAVVAIRPSSYAALKALASASEFLARSPGGLVAIPDLAELVALSGWPRTREAIIRMRQVCIDTRSTLILSNARLSQDENARLRALPWKQYPMPEPAREFDALLAGYFGAGGARLVDAFARSRGIRRDEMTAADARELAAFIERAIQELSGPAVDRTAAAGLFAQAHQALQAVEAFGQRDIASLAQGDWPSRSRDGTDDLVVTAAEYWKGKEMDELVVIAENLETREPLAERAKSVFIEQLGAAGAGLFASELAKLGKDPRELRPEDMPRLADRTAVDLGAMAEVVDVPLERARIEKQVESIRRRLEAIAGERA